MMVHWANIDGNYLISDTGLVYSSKSKRILSGSIARGYPRVRLWNNGKYKFEYIARLVAKAFIRNIHNKPCVNHIDGNPRNNFVSNLEWVTYSENTKHAYKNGMIDLSKRDCTRKINGFQVRVIKKCNDLTGVELAEIFNCSPQHISMIKSRVRHGNDKLNVRRLAQIGVFAAKNNLI